jgi:hypothetical protein
MPRTSRSTANRRRMDTMQRCWKAVDQPVHDDQVDARASRRSRIGRINSGSNRHRILASSARWIEATMMSVMSASPT